MINVVKEMIGLVCIRGKFIDLKVWIMDVVDSFVVRVCWKIVGEFFYFSVELDIVNMKKNVVKYFVRIVS